VSRPNASAGGGLVFLPSPASPAPGPAARKDSDGESIFAAWHATIEDDPDSLWNLVAMARAYRYRIGREAWRQFSQDAGIDTDYLVKGNYQGMMLELCDEKICDLAPTAEELRGVLERAGYSPEEFQTAHTLAASWRRLLAQVFPEEAVTT
jgi:hypothetical protein